MFALLLGEWLCRFWWGYLLLYHTQLHIYQGLLILGVSSSTFGTFLNLMVENVVMN